MILNLPENYKDIMIIVLGCTNIVTLTILVAGFIYSKRRKSCSLAEGKSSDQAFKPFDPKEITFENVIAQTDRANESNDEKFSSWPWSNQRADSQRYFSSVENRSLTPGLPRCETFSGRSAFLRPPSTVHTCLMSLSSKPSSVSSIKGDNISESVFNESLNSPKRDHVSDSCSDVTLTSAIVSDRPFSSLPKRNTFRGSTDTKGKRATASGKQQLVDVRSRDLKSDEQNENIALKELNPKR